MPQVAVIVGVGEGVGLAVARRFGQEGYHTALVARRQDALESYAQQLSQQGVSARGFAADAANPEALRETFAAINTALGAPEVLVYNAAAGVSGMISTVEIEPLQRAWMISVGGALVAAQQVIPEMRANRKGTILFTGGGLALNPSPAYGALAIGKAGIRSLAYSLGAELEPDGIHVATVTISGFVQPGTHFDPDTIATQYWALHTQPAGSWEREIVYR